MVDLGTAIKVREAKTEGAAVADGNQSLMTFTQMKFAGYHPFLSVY